MFKGIRPVHQGSTLMMYSPQRPQLILQSLQGPGFQPEMCYYFFEGDKGFKLLVHIQTKTGEDSEAELLGGDSETWLHSGMIRR